jgi:Glucose / Sorbosone dehydrogenase
LCPEPQTLYDVADLHIVDTLKVIIAAGASMIFYAAGASAELTLHIKDYVTAPMTGSPEGAGNNEPELARVNFLREEPGGANRFFVNDLTGPLYIFDKKTKKFTTYLNLKGLFHKLTTEVGLASGFISFEFDPDYARNGKFYTIHLEDPALGGSNLPDNADFPSLKITGYAASDPIRTPGPIQRDAVVVEWTDTNTSNSSFEGSARELMRVQLNSRIHPMGDLIFNPTARRGEADWRVMYIACGDGGSGEQKSSIRSNPQRLDTVVGKILRIVPDLKEHTDSSSVSENGRYRIPNDNPFASKAGARKEIWAYGLRNPHRMSWDVDPAGRGASHLIANVIGLHTWETVVIIHKGANYGYSLREGNEQLGADNTIGKLPEIDKIPVQLDESTTDGTVAPTYPVVQYAHVKEGGDAVSSGYVYRGKAIPALRGKFIFGDITTGHVWYVDYKEMLAADDGDPKTMAAMHEVKIRWDGPNDSSPEQFYPSMAPITEAAYHFRGGKAPGLPGFARVSGGRSDIRFAMDSSGELYILSKSDGMIRAIVGAAGN